MYSRWRLLAFNLEGVLARSCALPELVHIPAEVTHTLDALSKEVRTPPFSQTGQNTLSSLRAFILGEGMG